MGGDGGMSIDINKRSEEVDPCSGTSSDPDRSDASYPAPDVPPMFRPQRPCLYPIPLAGWSWLCRISL